MTNSQLIPAKTWNKLISMERTPNYQLFYRVLCCQKDFLKPKSGITGSVRRICFAAKASKGLKPLFPLCLADFASLNYQKLCVIVVAGFGEMAGTHVSVPLPHSFTLIVGPVVSFLSFFFSLTSPCFISK